MSKARRKLPEYTNPPVVEVVCGVQFTPLDKLRIPHVGLIWQRFRPDYASYEETPELTHVIESPDSPVVQSVQFQVQLTDKPPVPRVMFIHRDSARLIQVQQDRFLYNWRKREAEQEYPRFHGVLDAFMRHWHEFLASIDENQLGCIVPDQYEMTYVNHIWEGQGWNTVDDLPKVFPDISWRAPSRRFLPQLEGISLKGSFPLPDRKGRLHFSVATGTNPGGTRLLVFELTARGFPGVVGEEPMSDWFDLAHEWIVRGFADLTGDEIQSKVWGKRA